MSEVLRRQYLRKLESGKDRTDVVKVVTGMRGCGKTVLVKQYIRKLIESGVPQENVVYINFESGDWNRLTTHCDILEYVSSNKASGRLYVFLDEIQRIKSWEMAVNVLQTDYDADVYVIGSSANVTSSEMSTYLTGRIVELRVLPLSFSEFLELYPGDRNLRFTQYLYTGSLPVANPEFDDEFVLNLLNGRFNTTLVNDVLAHCGPSNMPILMAIANHLYSNIGSGTSCNSIANSLNIENRYVRKYLAALENAFLIHKVKRYDIRGKKHLDTLERYYVSDIGTWNATFGTKRIDNFAHLIENVVYLELIRRGYQVSVGKYGDTEVDFVVHKANDVEYYQVTASMMSESTYDREIRPFRLIGDNYSKIVLSMDKFLIAAPDGIKHLNLIDWLLSENAQ